MRTAVDVQVFELPTIVGMPFRLMIQTVQLARVYDGSLKHHL